MASPSRARLLLAAAAVALAAAGCDTLFPEFSGKPPMDAAVGDGGNDDGGDATPRLAGVVCVLRDLRDWRSCASGSPGVLRVTVEETREMTMTDVAGHFTLPLTQKLQSATVAAVDPLGHFATTVMPVRLVGGVAVNLALPLADAQALSDSALQNGLSLDPQRGTVLVWAVDPTGAPVAGVTSDKAASFVEGAATNQLEAGRATRAHGALALFDVPPSSLTLALTPPPTLPLSGDSFTLPVRAGALTLSTLVLPAR